MTIVASDQGAKRAHSRLLVARATRRSAPTPTLRRAPRAPSNMVPSRHIANRDPTEASRQSDHRDAPAAPAGQALDPARATSRSPATAPTRPRRLHQQTAELARPRFRNVPAMPALRRTVFARHEPERRTDLRRRREARAHHRPTRETSARRRGPTPGTVCSRATTGSAAACALQPRVDRRDLARSAASTICRNGASVSASAGGQGEAREPRRHALALPAGSR